MLTSIVKATRAHYAALQHKPAPDRIPLDYCVKGHTTGTIYVKAPTESRRRTEMTKLMNRLQSMFPEAAHIEATYREPAETSFGSGTVTWAPQVFVDGQWSSNALVFATKAEAIHYARDLFARWALCTDFRAVESPLPANYSYHDCNLKELT